MDNGAKVLVTGGFGFLGSHIVKRLIKENAKVFIIDLPKVDKYRLENYLNKVKVFEVDIQNSVEIDNILDSIKPDYIVHLASYGVNSKYKDPILAANINIIGSINIINSIIKIGCKKFINFGSSSEYGDSIAKEDNILKPVDIYGSTKACATIILHQMAKENNINMVTLRPFGIFGEGEEPHKVFSYVIINLLKDNEVLLTNCQQYRDYCHVDNIVNAVFMAGLNNNISNEIFNIASGQSYPLKNYINLIYKLINKNKTPVYGYLEYRNVERFTPIADISKAKSVLGFDITVPLEEGLKKTILWYKNNIYKYKNL